MYDYTHNKSPKDKKLCQLIRKTITINRKELGLEFKDVAFELGLNEGTLSNKLKPSMHNSDMTITEFMHFLELTGSYEALEYMASEFDFMLLKNETRKPTACELNTLIDNLTIENGDLFKVAKKALSDGIINQAEKEIILKELDDVINIAAQTKEKLKGL